MSAASLPSVAVPSQKRPLEEPSSDSGLVEQPEAKRPALDNIKQDDGDVEQESVKAPLDKNTDEVDESTSETVPTSGAQGEATYSDQAGIKPSAVAVLETRPIQSTTSVNASSSTGAFQNQHQDETGWLHIRAIISSAEAATVIGKGGENVTLIRQMSGAKCTVSDYARGAVERVLTVSGLVDAVAKVGYLLPPSCLSQLMLMLC